VQVRFELRVQFVRNVAESMCGVNSIVQFTIIHASCRPVPVPLAPPALLPFLPFLPFLPLC